LFRAGREVIHIDDPAGDNGSWPGIGEIHSAFRIQNQIVWCEQGLFRSSFGDDRHRAACKFSDASGIGFDSEEFSGAVQCQTTGGIRLFTKDRDFAVWREAMDTVRGQKVRKINPAVGGWDRAFGKGKPFLHELDDFAFRNDIRDSIQRLGRLRGYCSRSLKK
jgi:hypothetical protein